jgi:shikimate kinase
MDNISFIGMAGCGKSTIGKALSIKLGVNFIDTDLLIEEKFKASLEQIKKNKGYKFVRQAEEDVILATANKNHFYWRQCGIFREIYGLFKLFF